MRAIAKLNGAAGAWLAALTGVSVVCLLATAFHESITSATGLTGHVFHLLQFSRFGLSGENSIGPWWQGMLLLIASVHALDGQIRYRTQDVRLARAWLFLAIVLCCLSLDEVGSLHERVMLYSPSGKWLSVLPFALVLGSMAAYAIAILLRSTLHRPAGYLIAVAFALFAATALQEKLEWSTRWWGEFDDLRTALEEGTEMVAMLLLVIATMGNTAGLFARTSAPVEPTLQSLERLRIHIMTVGLLAAPILGVLSARLPDQQRGLPARWLGAALFACGALAALRPILRTGFRGPVERADLLLAASCGLLSVIAANAHGPRFNLAVLTAASVAVVVMWLIRGHAQGVRTPVAAVIGLCVVLGFAWELVSAAATMTAFAAAGALIYAGNAVSAASYTSAHAGARAQAYLLDATGTFERPPIDEPRA